MEHVPIRVESITLKQYCPLCAYIAPKGRTDCIRKHVKRIHKDWVNEVRSGIATKYMYMKVANQPNVVALYGKDKKCVAGFCFSCCSYIMKVGSFNSSAVRDHKCKLIKGCEASDTSSEISEPVTVSGTQGVFDMLKGVSVLGHLRLEQKEEQARLSHTEMKCADEFNVINAVLVPILVSCGKEEIKISNLRRSVEDLMREKAEVSELYDELKEHYSGLLKEMNILRSAKKGDDPNIIAHV